MCPLTPGQSPEWEVQVWYLKGRLFPPEPARDLGAQASYRYLYGEVWASVSKLILKI